MHDATATKKKKQKKKQKLRKKNNEVKKSKSNKKRTRVDFRRRTAVFPWQLGNMGLGDYESGQTTNGNRRPFRSAA